MSRDSSDQTSNEQGRQLAQIKGRGMAKASLALIDVMYDITSAMQPITGRGVGYKLFTRRLIESMSKRDMAQVYRLLLIAREQGTIPWEWIVDESRELERVSTWKDPAQFAKVVARSYRRDFWNHQPRRVQVWSEKGTVRGVLKPVLDEYAVGFLAVGGFSSGTKAYDVSQDDDGRPLNILYAGDIDPSGMFMSEVDLPERFARYGGDHITIRRIALTFDQLHEYSRTGSNLPSFPASDKGPKGKSKGDPRYPWFVRNYGDRCWELDAMDPNDLRDCVKQEIVKLIEPVAWQRCEVVNKAEVESMRSILTAWAGKFK